MKFFQKIVFLIYWHLSFTVIIVQFFLIEGE